MGPIDIVITSYNRVKFTGECIRYICARTRTPYRLIVVDNGSLDDTQELLHGYRGDGSVDIFVEMNMNAGIHAAKNVGLSLVQSPVFVSMDDDIYVPDLEPDWLHQLYELLRHRPEFAAISMRPQVMVGDGGNMFDGSPEVLTRGHVGSAGRIMRTNVVRNVGGWRKEIKPGRDNEEKHICSRLAKAGYKVGYARDVRCYHAFGNDDNWGYGPVPMEVHGHRPMWPMTNFYTNRFKADPKTWEPLK